MEEPRSNLYVERVHREVAGYSSRFLCGLGGDELFRGYENTSRFKLARRLSKMVRFPGGITLASMIRNRMVGIELTQGLKRNFQWLYISFISPLRYHPELWDDAYQRMNLIGVEHIKDFEEYCYLVEWRTKMVEDTLVPEYKMARIHNLDIRFPLADHRVINAAFSTPFKNHIKEGEGKFFMKEAMKDLLPSTCLKKPKRGFSFSPLDMYRSTQKYLDDLLSGSDPVNNYFGTENLVNLKREMEIGRNLYRNARTLILLYAFHFWAERFLQ
jgi:asparagine synthase (glutamine-hydrolysing)